MTKIKNIFKKDIDRDIRGVIKIGQDSEKIKKQELEEYVITDELKNDFTRFFDAYDKSIDAPTDKMGAWISGFFGSGKSHFLKILSYLLENDIVDGRKAVDYFLEDGKFDDNHLSNAIEKATSVSTDVALFNIDSKADSNSANDSSAILNVFLKVFNEQLGYSPIAEVADMERWLDSIGKYDAFKKAFQDLDPENHSSWEETRSRYAIMLNTRIKPALISSGALDEVDAQNYINEFLSKKFSIDAIGFAKLVKDYLDKKDGNHHFVFLADEVGQFIGEDDNKMLNLQTIVEQLGIQCRGRAWVVVTSQQQMDEVTGNFHKHERDFSKIQGRFNTLISMSSANADEVIRKRLLDKKPLAKEELDDLFTQNEYSINNKINFSDAIKREKYEDSQSFVDNYPFIPYQFSLLKDVLSAVRKHGASGSHMSDGERSMLATFQEATRRYEDDDLGKLVPFSAFFIGMKEFLNHDHQAVFDRAMTDRYVAGNKGGDSFNIQVLAVLFMVRYVDNYPSTLENITTLLLDDINQDRQELTAKVKDALSVLIRQNLIQKNLDTYEFLTDSEQEVNEAINAIDIDDQKIVREIGSYLFTSNLIDSKYVYPKKKNQYIFEFNMYIDGTGLNPLKNDLNIRIVSPLQSGNYREIDYKQQSGDNRNIIVVLKDDDRYIENYRQVEKIKEYMQKPESRSDEKIRYIAANRNSQAKDIERNTQKMLEDDLLDADIYVDGDVLAKGNNFASRLAEAKKTIIDANYRNLQYIDDVKSDQDIINVLKGTQNDVLLTDNEQAINAVIEYINGQAGLMNNISLSSVVDRFGKIPYGYKPNDTAWLVAKAFSDGKLKIYFNNSKISLDEARKDPKSIQRYFISKSNLSRLTMKPVKEISAREKKDAKEFASDVLEVSLVLPDGATSEQLADEIKKKTQQKVRILEDILNYNHDNKYPGKDILHEGINSLKQISMVPDSDQIFSIISKHLDDLEDWRDEVEDKAILQFYGDIGNISDQEKIWRKSNSYLARFNHAKGFIEDENLKEIANELEKYLDMDQFNISIPKLKNLNSEFVSLYSDDMDKVHEKIIGKVNESYDRLKSLVTDAEFPKKESDELFAEVNNTLKSISDRADQYNESSDENAFLNLISLDNAIESANDRLRNKISEVSQKLAEKAQEEQEVATRNVVEEATNPDNKQEETVKVSPSPQPKPTVKIKKTIFKKIYDVVPEDSWKIENEADIDKYLNALKVSLEKELEYNDIINIDFK